MRVARHARGHATDAIDVADQEAVALDPSCARVEGVHVVERVLGVGDDPDLVDLLGHDLAVETRGHRPGEDPVARISFRKAGIVFLRARVK